MKEPQTQRDLLVSLQRLEFDRAANLEKRVRWLQIAAGAMAVIGLAVPENSVTQALSPFSFLLALGTFWMNYQSRAHRLIGDKARRATLLVDGLGLRLSSGEIRRFAASTNASPEKLGEYNDPAYFATTEEPGVKRAAEMLQENAFWSMHLFRASARQVDRWLVVAGLGSVLVFFLSLSLYSTPNNSIQLKFFSAVASSIVSIEFMMRSLNYRLGAADVEEIYQRLIYLEREGYPKDDFLLAVVDYNSAVESAPMMAPNAYRDNCVRLEGLWKGRYQ